MGEQVCECSMFVCSANILAMYRVLELRHSVSAAHHGRGRHGSIVKFVGNKFVPTTGMFVGEICGLLERSGGSLAAPALPIPSLTPPVQRACAPRQFVAATPHRALRVRQSSSRVGACSCIDLMTPT